MSKRYFDISVTPIFVTYFFTLLLSLEAWWKQGFWRAFIGGASLCGFLVLMVFLADWSDIAKRKRRSERGHGNGDLAYSEQDAARWKNSMLDLFMDWSVGFAEKNKMDGTTIEVTRSEPSGTPSVRLDVGTPTVVARITVWETGAYDAEVIDSKTGKVLFLRVGALEGPGFDREFEEFCSAAGLPIVR
jgi:hypothetical protein